MLLHQSAALTADHLRLRCAQLIVQPVDQLHHIRSAAKVWSSPDR